MDLSKLSNEDLLALQSGDLSKLSNAGLVALQPTESNVLKDLAGGAVSGAASIGATLLTPVDYLARKAGIQNEFIGREDRRQKVGEFMRENTDPNSLAFRGAELVTQIAGTAGAPSVAAKGLAAIPQAAKYAPALASGGFNLGQAATGNAGRDMLVRALMGGAGGAMQAGMVNPDDAGMGAVVGAATPSAVRVAGMAGDAIRGGLDSTSRRLMQSALKPTIEQLRTGKAERAIDTLLREGVNPTAKGVERLGAMVDDVNSQVGSLIANSGASVSKRRVLDGLNETGQRFARQVSPTSDLEAITAVGQDFIGHPMLPSGDAIPVQLAQELKQGTYRALKDKAYGETKGAATEAQKALARALKEEIGSAVPSVKPLNAREADLINALKVAERRVLMDSNKNPVGLGPLAHNPANMAMFLADRSALAKSLAARGINRLSSVTPYPAALPEFVERYGVLGAPSVAVTSSP